VDVLRVARDWGSLSDIRFTDGGKVVSPMRRSFLLPERFLVLNCVRGWVDLRAVVLLERLGKLKKKIHLLCDSNRRPSGCSTVPQPTTLLRAPCDTVYIQKCIISKKLSEVLAYLRVWARTQKILQAKITRRFQWLINVYTMGMLRICEVLSLRSHTVSWRCA
jgi:hypothetical protein